MSKSLVAGNYYDKYRTQHPIHQRLVGGFLAQAAQLLKIAQPETILEIGCGPGDLAERLLSGPEFANRRDGYLGVDISKEQVQMARRQYSDMRFAVATAYYLPVASQSFDLVMACEVIEHLERPQQAMDEISRVACSYALISVPWEPVWCALNMLRGKYLRRLGNTPGHVNHFTRKQIRSLVARSFNIVEERHPFPWTMILARRP